MITSDSLLILHDLFAQHSPTVYAHCRRVKNLVMAFALWRNVDDYCVRSLELGALLHDIGKTLVAPDLLDKPGELTISERLALQQHVDYGLRYIRAVPFLSAAASIIAHHHERWDGQGYPNRLAGTDIPIEARLVALADCWDALVSERAYKPAYTYAQATAEIQASEGQFDPQLLSDFLRFLTEKGWL